MLGLVLRLLKLGSQSYWHDEAYTVIALRFDFTGMLAQVGEAERTPYLFYVVAWAWTQLFGDTEVALRSLSVISGVGTIVAIYAAGARLFSRPVGLVAALLAALNPLLIWYSQEARSYGLVTFLAALSLLGFARSLTEGRRGDYALWSVASAAAVATHYFAAFPVLVEAVLLLRNKGPERRFAFAAVLPAGVAIALLPLAAGQLAQRPGGDPFSSVAARLGRTGMQVLLGEKVPVVTSGVMGLLLGLLVLAVVMVAWRSSRDVPTPRIGTCAAIALSAPIAATLAAFVGPDFFITRNMLVGAPAALVALGAVFVAARRAVRTGAVAALCVVFLAGELLMLTNLSLQRDDWRHAAATVEPDEGCDALLVYLPSNVRPLSLYRPDARALPPTGARVHGVGVLWTRRFRRLPPSSWWRSWTNRGVGPLPPAVADMTPVRRRFGRGLRYIRYAAMEPRKVGPDDLLAGGRREPKPLLVCRRMSPRPGAGSRSGAQ